jgi:hypothetical protein
MKNQTNQDARLSRQAASSAQYGISNSAGDISRNARAGKRNADLRHCFKCGAWKPLAEMSARHDRCDDCAPVEPRRAGTIAEASA